MRSKKAHVADVDIGSQIAYGLGLGYAVGPPGRKRSSLLIAELGALAPTSKPLNISHTDHQALGDLEARLALRQELAKPSGPVSMVIGAGFGLVRGYGEPLVRFMFALDFTNADPAVDRDFDGIADVYDKCPDQAEDRDGFQDDDGCPDVDNDNDGVPDDDDDCPNEAANVKGVGISDGCPVPVEADADKDGIPDAKDKCPSEAEDFDGFEDDDGCPDIDNDHDGLPDINDLCPDAAEDIEGFQDDDGCPDGGKEASLVSLQPDGLKLHGQIRFAHDKDQLTPTSQRIIDQLAKIMREHAEVTRVRISVYPERRNRRSNKLANDRAQKIKIALGSRGVPSNRIEADAAGYERRHGGRVEVQAQIAKKAAPPKKR
jgi:large repetitive protein